MRASRFFRYVWRVNALLVLALAAAVLAMISSSFVSNLFRKHDRRDTPAVQAVVEDASDAPLKLGPPRAIAGTRILRADLVRTRPGKSSYGSGSHRSETHNVLFIDPMSSESHWLLNTHRNLIAYTEDISPFAPDAKGERPPLATLVLVKQPAESEAETGELLLFDRSGTQVAAIGDKVRRVHATLAVSAAEFVVVFERGGKYHIARFEAPTRRRIGESEIKLPALR
jgi:hypothetical protein